MKDLREVRFEDLERVSEILERYKALPVPKEFPLVFAEHLLLKRDAWFVEVGDVGLLYLTRVVPEQNAFFHVVFWDQSLGADRVSVARSFIQDAFIRFMLDRITAAVSHENVAMKRFLREVGFTLEGNTRRGWSIDPPVDMIQFGMLAEEVAGG